MVEWLRVGKKKFSRWPNFFFKARELRAYSLPRVPRALAAYVLNLAHIPDSRVWEQRSRCGHGRYRCFAVIKIRTIGIDISECRDA